jgi:polyisoprenoid-binding protein YceI
MMRMRRPRSRRDLLRFAAAGLVTLAVALFLLIYFVIFPTSSPKPFKLTAVTSAATTTTTSSAAPTTSSTQTTPTSSQQTATSALAGSWKIATGSQAGYRVREKLAFLPAQSDAVGRTPQISGEAGFAEAGGKLTIRSASFTIAVNTLTSDRSMRDEKIHSIGLESDRYPTATFALSSPLTIPVSELSGHVAHLTVTGVVEIHGVSKTERIPVELTLAGSTVEAAGSFTFPWSEFGMTAPSVGGFVNVTEHATMEFDLRLQRA